MASLQPLSLPAFRRPVPVDNLGKSAEERGTKCSFEVINFVNVNVMVFILVAHSFLSLQVTHLAF